MKEYVEAPTIVNKSYKVDNNLYKFDIEFSRTQLI